MVVRQIASDGEIRNSWLGLHAMKVAGISPYSTSPPRVEVGDRGDRSYDVKIGSSAFVMVRELDFGKGYMDEVSRVVEDLKQSGCDVEVTLGDFNNRGVALVRYEGGNSNG